MKIEVANIDDLKKNLQTLVKTFSSRQVLLLNGPMGVGKTQIVKCLGEIYGLPDEASSPSFALHNEYQNEKIRIDHLDLYRLESEEELESSGFWDLFSNEEGLIVIEWAERLPSYRLDKRWSILELFLEFKDSPTSTTRILSQKVHG